jgi:hypothetical protein
MVGTWRRYSWRAVSLPANPRSQPSIMASENVHAAAVAHVTNGTARHGNRPATLWPASTTATAMTMAGTVPHPTCASHHPKMGAVPAKSRKRSGVALISGVTLPRFRCGTTNAATTSTTATVTATTSRVVDPSLRPPGVPTPSHPRWAARESGLTVR